ncbi:MAG: PQQ-binding-like beta-propeller repeat protein [Opitutaceae bacterium]
MQGWSVSSPAVSPDGATIYVGVETRTAGRLVAVAADGTVRWSILRPDGISASPAVGPDGTVYAACYDGKLYAINPANGAIRWQYDAGSFIVSSPAIGEDGSAYFGAGDGRLHAVDARGVRRWTFQTGDWVESSPALGADGTVYFGSRDRSFYAVAPDGREKWRFAVSGAVTASPALGADGTIYFGAADQRMYALFPDGRKRWDFFTNGDIQASPVLGADGAVYFAALDSSFYALEPDSGALRWRVPLNTNSVSTAAVRADGSIILGADDGIVRALSPADGSVRWRFDTRKAVPDDTIDSSPLLAPDGSIYFTSLDGRLYKLRGNGVGLSEVSNWPAFRGDARRTGRAYFGVGLGRLLNLSVRAPVVGRETLIAGFVVQGAAAKAYLVRGVGPGLGGFGVAGFLPDPRLDLYAGAIRIGGNDNWEEAPPGLSVTDTAAAVGAFPLSAGSRDAAIVVALPPGPYSAHLRAADEAGGVALFEAYDAIGGDPGSRFINLSLRGRAGVGDSTLIAGLVVGGTGPVNLLLRAVGPGLIPFGVERVLERPKVSLFSGAALVRANDGWSSVPNAYDLSGAARATSAFPLATGSADAALTVVVSPGPYTIHVAGADGSAGEVLTEVYVLR